MRRQPSLDAWRGLAALAVFGHHAWNRHAGLEGEPRWAQIAGGQLRLGLVLFFVLSGYLIWAGVRSERVHRGSFAVGAYLRRRALRIAPAYYLAIAGSIALLWASQGAGPALPPADHLPLYAVFAQNFSPETHLRLDPVTWSLCVEVGFYLLLVPLGLALCRWRCGRRGEIVLLAALFVAGIAWRLAVYAAGGDILWQKALPAFLPYFALGMALVLLAGRRPGSLSRRASLVLLVAGAVLIVGDAAWHGGAFGPTGGLAERAISNIPSALGFCLLICAGINGAPAIVGWLEARPLRRLGDLSYGFYLWHLPLLYFLARLGFSGGFAATFALALVPSLLLAAASWHLVERPLLERRRRGPLIDREKPNAGIFLRHRGACAAADADCRDNPIPFPAPGHGHLWRRDRRSGGLVRHQPRWGDLGLDPANAARAAARRRRPAALDRSCPA
jgi:peptidoglycan/LPS O-acetylase OafA/YrhL